MPQRVTSNGRSGNSHLRFLGRAGRYLLATMHRCCSSQRTKFIAAGLGHCCRTGLPYKLTNIRQVVHQLCPPCNSHLSMQDNTPVLQDLRWLPVRLCVFPQSHVSDQVPWSDLQRVQSPCMVSEPLGAATTHAEPQDQVQMFSCWLSCQQGNSVTIGFYLSVWAPRHWKSLPSAVRKSRKQTISP